MEKDVRKRAEKIRLLALDVDGTLTDGRLLIGPEGEIAKTFHARDGLGMAAALRAGLKIALITGRSSACVVRRAEELGIEEVYLGATDKVAALEALAVKFSLQPEEIAYAGDDLNDLPALQWAGLPCAVSDAAAEVRRAACWVTECGGGQGAARELVEGILAAQGRWEAVVASYQRAAQTVRQ